MIKLDEVKIIVTNDSGVTLRDKIAICDGEIYIKSYDTLTKLDATKYRIVIQLGQIFFKVH